MLSDSVFETIEKLWTECVVHYDYSDQHKEQLVDVITDLSMLLYKMDLFGREDKMSRDKMKKLIVAEWDERIAAAPLSSWRR
jgi:hypothetical protein